MLVVNILGRYLSEIYNAYQGKTGWLSFAFRWDCFPKIKILCVVKCRRVISIKYLIDNSFLFLFQMHINLNYSLFYIEHIYQ